MTRFRAPAALPTLVALFALGVADDLPLLPVRALVALLALAAALGGRKAVFLAACAGALLIGRLERPVEPRSDPGLVAEVEGRICGFWRRSPESGSRAARLCPDWLRQAHRVTARSPTLWLTMPLTIDPPPFGARVRAQGSLGRFAGFANANPSAPGPWRLRLKSTRQIVQTRAPSLLARTALAIRARVEGALADMEPAGRRGVALARGLVLGDEGAFPAEVRRGLRRAGLAHLMAVSGFNLTLVCSLVALVASLGSGDGRLWMPAFALLLYLGAIGPDPSVSRAAWVVAAGFALVLARRAGSPLQAQAIAALILVSFDPAIVHDRGFQLSFAATAGLLVCSLPWRELFGRTPPLLSLPLAATFGAQVATLPWAVSAFGEISPLSPGLNLLALPWTAISMIVTLPWTVVALLAPSLARGSLPLLELLSAPLFALDSLPASLWISAPVPGGLAAGCALAATIALIFEAGRRGRRRLVMLCLVALTQQPKQAADAQARVLFLDVGQGDAAILRTGEVTVLIDGGGLVGRNVGAEVVRAALLETGASRVDLAVVSHAHRDHCEGMIELAAEIPIEALWLPVEAATSGCHARLAARLAGGIRAVSGAAHWRRGGLELSSIAFARPKAASDPNAASLVIAAVLGGRQLLFLGDLSAAEERSLVGALSRRTFDLLKVAHHGSSSATTVELLLATRPRRSVISAGVRNPFGHPAAATLARLVGAGSWVNRTDRDGAILWSWRIGEPMRLELPGTPRAQRRSD